MSTSTTHCRLHHLVPLLLCLISLHACNARRLVAVDPNKPENKFLHSINKGSDDNITVVPKVKSFTSSKPALEVTRGSEITVESTEFNYNSNPPTSTNDESNTSKKYHKNLANVKNIASKKRKGSSSVSVSWRVPHNKGGIHKQPGFNLDYSPPKTHPPHHN